MVILLIFLGIAAFVVSFLAVVILTTILSTLCEPKTRFGATLCFAVRIGHPQWAGRLGQYDRPLAVCGARHAAHRVASACLDLPRHHRGWFYGCRQQETSVTLEARWSCHVHHLTSRCSERPPVVRLTFSMIKPFRLRSALALSRRR
jgi:hypothetical protein